MTSFRKISSLFNKQHYKLLQFFYFINKPRLAAHQHFLFGSIFIGSGIN
jgi:hypothetical protein